MRKVGAWGSVAVLGTLGLGLILTLIIDGPRGYLPGDAQLSLFIADSLWHDHDLDVDNQFPDGAAHFNDLTALDKRGRFVPKHPIVMPAASIPFLLLFGKPGALLFNLFQAAVIFLALYLVAARFAALWSAALAVLLTGVASFVPHYLWDYSSDLFSVVPVVLALLLLPQAGSRWPLLRHAAAGVALGVAPAAKTSLILALPAALLLCTPPRRRRVVALVAGAAVPLVGYLLLNWHLFGSPWTTSYDRIVRFDGERYYLHSQRLDFDLPLWQGVRGQLLASDHGLLWTSPITLVSFALLPLLARRRRGLAWYVGATSVALFLFFAKYRYWPWSSHGNRFLLLPVFLGALPLAAGLAWVRDRLRPRQSTQAP